MDEALLPKSDECLEPTARTHQDSDHKASQTTKIWSRRCLYIVLIFSVAFNVGACVLLLVRADDREAPKSSLDVSPPTQLEESIEAKVYILAWRVCWIIMLQLTDHPILQSCGDNVHTYRQRGCIIDLMLAKWVPPLCHDAEFARSIMEGFDGISNSSIGSHFEPPGGYVYFEDELLSDRLQQTPEQRLWSLAYEGRAPKIYSQPTWHAAHCAYVLRLVVRMVERLSRGESPVWIPSLLVDSEHAAHCEKHFGILYQTHLKPHDHTTVGIRPIDCVRVG